MKAIEQYFHVVLFTMLYKVIPLFKSAKEALVCHHSNESYWACGTIYYDVQGGSNLNPYKSVDNMLEQNGVPIQKVQSKGLFFILFLDGALMSD